MRIKIISKKDRFRRCGIEHSASPKTYEDGFFTQDQIRMLQEEPMLVVEELPEKDKKGKKENVLPNE